MSSAPVAGLAEFVEDVVGDLARCRRAACPPRGGGGRRRASPSMTLSHGARRRQRRWAEQLERHLAVPDRLVNRGCWRSDTAAGTASRPARRPYRRPRCGGLRPRSCRRGEGRFRQSWPARDRGGVTVLMADAPGGRDGEKEGEGRCIVSRLSSCIELYRGVTIALANFAARLPASASGATRLRMVPSCARRMP